MVHWWYLGGIGHFLFSIVLLLMQLLSTDTLLCFFHGYSGRECAIKLITNTSTFRHLHEEKSMFNFER